MFGGIIFIGVGIHVKYRNEEYVTNKNCENAESQTEWFRTVAVIVAVAHIHTGSISKLHIFIAIAIAIDIVFILIFILVPMWREEFGIVSGKIFVGEEERQYRHERPHYCRTPR